MRVSNHYINAGNWNLFHLWGFFELHMAENKLKIVKGIFFLFKEVLDIQGCSQGLIQLDLGAPEYQ